MLNIVAGALGGNAIGGIVGNLLGGGKGGGLMDSLLGGGKGGGPLGILGGLAQKLFDPAGILGLGNQGQKAAMGDANGELKEAIASLKEMIGEMMAMLEGKESPQTAGAGQPININTGAGDDTVNVTLPPSTNPTSAVS